MKLHLLDGTYELFRAFYGPPGAKAPDGREVGATRAFMRSLLMLLQSQDCTHVGVAFDHTIESFRNDLFDGYKTGEGIDPDLFAQFPLVEEACEALGVVAWKMVEFEADDALASAAFKWRKSKSVDQVLIGTPDKDLAQCVTGSEVILWDRMRDREIDEAGVVEKWGVEPASIPDYLALVGDTADGIPGIPKWGAKSTATLLQTYKKLEKIPDDENKWSVKVRGAKGLAENLRSQREDAMLYRTLATLRTDVPLQEKLNDLKWRGANRKKLEKLCKSLGETRLISRIETWR